MILNCNQDVKWVDSPVPTLCIEKTEWMATAFPCFLWPGSVGWVCGTHSRANSLRSACNLGCLMHVSLLMKDWLDKALGSTLS